MLSRTAAFLLLVITAASEPAVAQTSETRVAVTGAGLLSVQPVDDFYVGPVGPYLDKGLGGAGPGASAGLTVVTGGRLALTFEYSTAWLAVEQAGRLVSGGRGTGRLRDSMLTALVGAHTGMGATTTQALAGISRLMTTPTSSGDPIDDPGTDSRRLVFTAGLDVVTRLGSRSSLVVSGRGYFVDRSARTRELGVGRYIFRIGAGLRVALNPH